MKKNINREQYQKKLRRKKRRLRPRLWFFLVLVTIFITMIIYSCSTLFNWNQDNKDVKKIEEVIENNVQPVEKKEQGNLVNPPTEKDSDYWYYVNVPFYDVDFSKLLKSDFKDFNPCSICSLVNSTSIVTVPSAIFSTSFRHKKTPADLLMFYNFILLFFTLLLNLKFLILQLYFLTCLLSLGKLLQLSNK